MRVDKKKYRFVKKGKCNDGEVQVGYFCEHCVDVREPFIMVATGGTWYCDNCYDTLGYGPVPHEVMRLATKALADEYERLSRKYDKEATRLRGLSARGLPTGDKG